MWSGYIIVAGKKVKISGPEEAYAEVNACLNWLVNNAGATALQSMPNQEQDIEYNGWPNYPTWLVYTWLGETQKDYLIARKIAMRSKSIGAAADRLKRFIAHKDPLAGEANMFCDFITYALGRVDWMRIANRLRQDCEL